MTNNEAREAFKAMGLTYSDIGSKEFFDLVKRLDEALPSHEFKMRVSRKPKSNAPKIIFDDCGKMKEAYIRCDSNYFYGREAISFNADGFIGFAGWASSKNTQIFLNVFFIWADSIAQRKVDKETYQDLIICSRNSEIKNLKELLKECKTRITDCLYKLYDEGGQSYPSLEEELKASLAKIRGVLK